MDTPAPSGRSNDELLSELETLRQELGVGEIPFCLFQKDRDGRMLAVDEAFCKFVSKSVAEITGRTDFDLFPVMYAQKYRDDDRRVMLEGKAFRTFESIRIADGSKRFIYVVKVPDRDQRGNIVGIRGAFGEISPRGNIEQCLRESEERLRSIIDGMPVMLSSLDERGRVVYWNRECERVTGYSAAEIVGNPCGIQILYPDAAYLRRMMEIWRRGEGPSRDWEWTLTCKDGSRRTVAWTTVGGEHPIAGWASWGLGIDVTEKRQALEILQAIREVQSSYITRRTPGELFDLLLEHLLIITRSSYGFIGEILLEPDGQPYLKTRSIARIARRKDARQAREQAPNEAEFDQLRALFETVVATGKPVFASDPQCNELPEGHPHRRALLGVPLFHENRLVGMAGLANRPGDYHHDTLEEVAPLLATCATLIHAHQVDCDRIRQEEERRKLEERFTLVARATTDLVWDWDLQTDRVWRNEGITNLFGYAPYQPETSGQCWVEHVHPDDRDRVSERLRTALEGLDEVLEDEYRFRRRDGSYAIVRNRAYILRDSSGKAFRVLGGLKDISEQRRLEEDRHRLEAQVQHSQKLESLGVLAGGIAHDFNNLLVSVLGNANLATQDLPSNSPAGEAIRQIEIAAMRAADLCKQMLAYSGKGRFVVRRMDLSALVEEMSHLLQVSIPKRVAMHYHLSRNLPPIEADASQIRQVVMNLITNASEACGDRSGTITLSTGCLHVDRDYLATHVLDTALEPGEYVFAEVVDTGCGMDAETQARIFDPFFTTKATGRGLGMAAVLGIVRGHRGAITCSSELGRGTTFQVLFPAAAGVPERQTESKAPARHRGTGTILVVDDEEGVRSVAQRSLERQGFKVVVARDGAEGVEVYRKLQDEISIVLLDMMMPHLNGDEVYRELRKIRDEVRVILSSGYSEQEATNHFTDKGLAGFIQKPYRPSELIEMVHRVLNGETDLTDPTN